jgi:hypothetical protein
LSPNCSKIHLYEHLQFKKNFLSSLALAIYGKGRGRLGGEGRRGEGKGKGKGEREGRQAGELAPPNTKTKLRL